DGRMVESRAGRMAEVRVADEIPISGVKMSPPLVTLNPSLPKCQLSFEVNGERIECLIAPQKTLLEVLREDLQLTGTKHGCELGECGTCTVLVDGVPILSCL